MNQDRQPITTGTIIAILFACILGIVYCVGYLVLDGGDAETRRTVAQVAEILGRIQNRQ